MRANWNLTVRRRSTDEDGTMHLEAELTDAGKKAGELVATVTAAGVLVVEWRAEPGSASKVDFMGAWSKEA